METVLFVQNDWVFREIFERRLAIGRLVELGKREPWAPKAFWTWDVETDELAVLFEVLC